MTDRLALKPDEAAQMLSVGRTFFRAKILPELATIKRGSVLLVPVAELRRWVEQQAVTSSDSDRRAGGRSGSGSTGRGKSSRRASRAGESELPLKELVARYSQRRSGEKDNVVPLRPGANHSGRSRRNG